MSCEYCDVETQQALASRLLHTLAVRSTLRKQTPDEAVAKLREKLLPPHTGKKAPTPSMETLDAALVQLEDARAKGLQYFSSKETLSQRVTVCERDLEISFRQTKRERLAAELIHAYDPAREHHCGRMLGGGDGANDAEASPASTAACERHRLSCIFRPLACRNEGCMEVFSARAEATHDGVCPFKLLPCVRGCPEVVTRQGMAAHADGPCANKPVDCPFLHLGCEAACTQGTLEAHLESATAAHLSLSLRALTAQQHSISKLEAAGAAAAVAVGELAAVSARVTALEGGMEEMRRALKSSEAELRQAMAKEVDGVNKQHVKDVKRLDEAQAKAAKAHSSIEKENHAAIDKLKKTIGEVVNHVKTLNSSN